MKLGTRPIDKINYRIELARGYISHVGWKRGGRGAATHGRVDIVGALTYAQDPDGYEIVAARLLATRGYDTAWNDLICQNKFEAMQALDQTFTNEDVEDVYGHNWYGIVGLLQLLTMAGPNTVKLLASHIGPADEPAILSLMEQVGSHPAFEDAHLVVSPYGFDRSVWMLTDALVANILTWPEVDDRVVSILAPVAEKLGLS